METWRTAIVDAGPDHIRVRGHDVLDLMRGATFTDLIFLLHHQRVPTAAERRLIDAILVGSADHGAGAPSCAAARLVVDEARAAKTRLPGFGHRVHATIDPRVDVLFGLAEESGLAGDGVRVVRALERAIAERIKPLPINIDGALAAILVDLGFPPLMGMLLFVIARVAGISAEVLEEHLREKPMRIRIPVEYDGVPPVDG